MDDTEHNKGFAGMSEIHQESIQQNDEGVYRSLWSRDRVTSAERVIFQIEEQLIRAV